MAITLIVNVDAVDDLLVTYGAGALLRWERSALPTSGFAEIGTLPLLAGIGQYEINDSAGTNASYYRTRYSNAAGSQVSDYSDVFQATAITAYATLASLLETMDIPTASEGKLDNLLSDLLVRASDRIDQLCGRDFYRHPQVSGSETRTYHVKRRGATSFSMAVGEGLDIVSLDSMTLSYVTGDTPTAVVQGANGYFLEPSNPKRGWPYEDLVLSNLGSAFYYFPTGYNIVSLTGVFGWAVVPPLVQQATIDLAREWYRQGPGGGGPVGVNQFGTPVFGPGTPTTVQAAYEGYRRQSFVYV